MSMEPDTVLMERKSWSANVPVTLLEISLIMVERDMIHEWVSSWRTAVDGGFSTLDKCGSTWQHRRCWA